MQEVDEKISTAYEGGKTKGHVTAGKKKCVLTNHF
jgi:hypothetical protein